MQGSFKTLYHANESRLPNTSKMKNLECDICYKIRTVHKVKFTTGEKVFLALRHPITEAEEFIPVGEDCLTTFNNETIRDIASQKYDGIFILFGIDKNGNEQYYIDLVKSNDKKREIEPASAFQPLPGPSLEPSPKKLKTLKYEESGKSKDQQVTDNPAKDKHVSMAEEELEIFSEPCSECLVQFSQTKSTTALNCGNTYNMPTQIAEETIQNVLIGDFEIITRTMPFKGTPKSFTSQNFAFIEGQVLAEIRENDSAYAFLAMNVEFSRNYIPEYRKVWFCSKKFKICNPAGFSMFWIESSSEILTNIENFTKNSSGWRENATNTIRLKIAKFPAVSVKISSYMPTPASVVLKRAIINVRNSSDQKCFLWSCLSALYPLSRNCSRVSSYQKFETKLNMLNIQYPVQVKDISKFERNNMNRYGINVFVIQPEREGRESLIFPYRLSQLENCEEVINLLLIVTDSGMHYTWIKNLSRLLSKNNSNHNGCVFFCSRCLHGFSREDLLRVHERERSCLLVKPKTVKLGKIVYDRNSLLI